MLKLLPTMLRLAGDNEEVREQAAFVAWRTVAGQQILYNCAPFRLYQKHLVISVPDQTWKKQMEMISGEYLFRINSVVGCALVTFIEFRVDHQHVLNSRQSKLPAPAFTHTQQLEDELQSAAACIKDDALRERFLHTAAKCLERNGE